MTLVITPVGTSLFANAVEHDGDIGRYFSDIRNERAGEWNECLPYIEPLREAIESFIDMATVVASAELQSTSAIQDMLQDDIRVHLIASDTIASRLAAEILRDKLPVNLSRITVEFDPNHDVIQGLCATDPNQFEILGVPILLERLNNICCSLQDSQNLAINITGGYAATVSLLTLFAKEKGCPLYYTFEETFNSIEILRYFP